MNLVSLKDEMEYELDMAGMDDMSYCCIDTDTMAAWVKVIEEAIKAEENQSEQA